MITADTITDEQIRELCNANPSDARILKACTCALGLSRGGATAQHNARRRCAEILNARRGETSYPMPMLPGLVARLFAVRDRLVGGRTFVWLCLDEDSWWTTEDHGAHKGRWFARVTIGKGDSDGAVRNAAEDLVEKMTRTLEAGARAKEAK